MALGEDPPLFAYELDVITGEPVSLKSAKKAEVPPPAGAKDTIAKSRALVFPTAEQFPPIPEGYQPTRLEERKRRLRPIPQDLIAEGLRALREIDSAGDGIRKDLGELAPDTSAALPLATRIEALEAAIGRQESLLYAYREIEDIALTDAVELLEAVYEEYEHRVKKVPSLATRYPMLAAYFKARSDAISKGIARAREGSEPAETTG
jgi:hypothetical protein